MPWPTAPTAARRPLPALSLRGEPDGGAYDALRWSCGGGVLVRIAKVRCGVEVEWLVEVPWGVEVEARRLEDGALVVRVVEYEEGTLYAPKRVHDPSFHVSVDGGHTWALTREVGGAQFAAGTWLAALSRVG